jgi:putative peptide zinc metalloprotease protein
MALEEKKALGRLRPDLEFRFSTEIQTSADDRTEANSGASAGGVTRIEAGNQGGVVVQDRLRQRYFHLSKPAAAVAKLLDGQRTVGRICAALEKQTGNRYAQHEVLALVEQLEGMGLLTSDKSVSSRPRPKRSWLALQIHLFDPDALLSILVRKLRFLFTPMVAVFAGILVFSALVVFALHWSEWGLLLARSLGWRSVITIYLPALLMMVFHEFAHGVACKYYGCPVHDMGVILYYLQPCTYCDVSASWMLDRRQRIYVMLAGVVAELVAWSCFVWAALWVPLDTVGGEVLVGLIASSGTKTLFNLNPLIKLDGYYVLSDLLRIPNLRQHSFAYLAHRLKRERKRKRSAESAIDADQETRKRRWAFAIYAPLALLYSGALLGFVAWWFWGGLVRRFGAAGHGYFFGAVILFGGGFWAVRRFNRLNRRGSSK